MIKLILSWLIIASIFFILTRDKGIAYDEPNINNCIPDYIGSCN